MCNWGCSIYGVVTCDGVLLFMWVGVLHAVVLITVVLVFMGFMLNN